MALLKIFLIILLSVKNDVSPKMTYRQNFVKNSNNLGIKYEFCQC